MRRSGSASAAPFAGRVEGARLVVVGDLLLDRDLRGEATRLCPDAPAPVIDAPETRSRPGGAGLAALLAAADGIEVTLVAPVAEDEGGWELRALLEASGVRLVALPLHGRTPEKVRVWAGRQVVARLDYGCPDDPVGGCSDQAREALDGADAVLVSDYGRGVTSEPSVRAALAACTRRVPVVWDPHPRGDQPVPGVRLATPNRGEALTLSGVADRGEALALGGVPDRGGLADATAAGAALLSRWSAAGVVVTLGSAGAVLVAGDGTPLVVPAPDVADGDPCGAGDRFASRVAGALAAGALVSEAVVDAVACAASFVGAGGAAGLDLGDAGGTAGPELGTRGGRTDEQVPVDVATRPRGADEVVAAVRAAGGTVVATGGCFDLLHAGHVRMLEEARALGDCLVVLLNSDDSVRRLKGPDRPLVPQGDRARVLAGLGCVDGVVVFDEDTPEAALAHLRPDIWAKGADYAVSDLPEAPLVASWGGQAVVVPYLDGRSTTRLIQEATRRARI